MVVESEIDKCVLVWNGGEGGSILYGVVQRSLVGGDERGSVGPVIHVSGGVDCKDNIETALRLDKWVQRNILSIFTSVDESEFV